MRAKGGSGGHSQSAPPKSVHTPTIPHPPLEEATVLMSGVFPPPTLSSERQWPQAHLDDVKNERTLAAVVRQILDELCVMLDGVVLVHSRAERALLDQGHQCLRIAQQES